MATYEQSPQGYEIYRSVSQAALASLAAAGDGAAAASPFTIEIRFAGGLTQSQKDAFAAAADRWTRVIVGDLPSATVDGETIDDLVILAQGAVIDGPGTVLGQAGPTALRPPVAGAAAFLPVKGRMTFDTADLAAMETRGTLTDVIAHEMGHVLGIGTVWSRKGLLAGAGTTNPTFQGANAMREYGVLKGTGPAPVPVENRGGGGTADSHWREILFRNELMSGFIAAAGNPLSRMTAASLGDLGYEIDLDAADPYSLANLFDLAEAGAFAVAEEESLALTMLPILPVVLPDQSVA
jgi:hypothetical protein